MFASTRWTLLLALLTVALCSAQNPCGGDRPLSASPGDPCDPGPKAGCSHGSLICAGENSLFCMCDDARYRASLLHSSRGWTFDETFCDTWKCGEHGVCMAERKACHCYPGYSGNHCEVFDDPCAHQTCGDHGMCVNLSGGQWSCSCFEGYTGKLCDTQLRCQPNGVWKNGQCKCREGFVGKKCDLCDKDGICLPTTDNEQPFAFALASDQARQDFLNKPLPPNIARRYAASHPILPNSEYEGVLYDCSCRSISSIQTSFSTDEPLKAGFLYINDDFWSPYDFSSPSSHLYREDFDEYYHSYYYYDNVAYGFAIMIGLFFFIVAYIWRCCRDDNYAYHHPPVPTPHFDPPFKPEHTEIQVRQVQQQQPPPTADQSYFTEFTSE